MLMVVKFICSLILSLGGMLAISNIENIKVEFKLKQIIWLIVLSLGTFLFSKIIYSSYQSILILLTMIFCYKEMFNFETVKAIVLTSIMLLLISLMDGISSVVFVNFIEISVFRTNALLMLLGNLIPAILIYLITKIKPLAVFIKNFVNNITQNRTISTIIELVLSITLLAVLTYNISRNVTFNIELIMDLLIFGLIGTIIFFYIKEQNNYNKLLDEYDKLIEYVQTFEEWIEEEQLELHESKNSLSAIYEMTDIEKVRKEINKILNRKGSLEDSWVTDLKPIPKGGLKGLLYYKFMIIKNHKLNIITDVSDNVTSKLKQLNKKDIKLLLRLIGIYFDNAIESANESRKKNISFEVYKLKNKINIVITNTYKNKVDINKIGIKGVSTKGANRGKGTYLAKKLVAKNKKFEISNNIINNYYVQKIIIN